MKLKILFSVTALLLLLSVGHVVLAHKAEQDGNVIAEVHIDPGDNPVIGQEAGIHFDFADTKEKLNLEKCGCTFIISENNKILLIASTTDKSWFNVEPLGIGIAYTFPEKGNYVMTIAGHTEKLTPFILHFEIKVDRSISSPKILVVAGSLWHTIFHHGRHIVIFGGAFVFGLAYNVYNMKKERRHKKELQQIQTTSE